MALPRFYAPGIDPAPGKRIILPEKARHHAGRVLRMAAGARLILFDGEGRAAAGPVSFAGGDAFIDVDEIISAETETPVAVTLIQALVAPEKMDWIVEKATETGAARIIAAPAERSVTKLSGERLAKRLAHWRSTAVSACEQCGRNTLPEITFLPTLVEALEAARAEARYMLAPGSRRAPKLSGLGSVAFAIGPEGGFSPAEINAALSLGWKEALIGPRVLRTETAGIVAVTLANAASGDYAFR